VPTGLSTAPGWGGNWQPNYVIRGAVEAKIGGLLFERGRDAKFAQIYVCDPSPESEAHVRLAHLLKGASKDLTSVQAAAAKILEEVQQELKSVNPLIKDVMTVFEFAQTLPPDLPNVRMVCAGRSAAQIAGSSHEPKQSRGKK